MDSLAEELKRRDVDATVHSYGEWQTLADQAAADYKARKEAPIILIGHSLGADSVMEMAAYLGRKGVPVALVVPFDCTKSFAASDNVAHVLNLTHSGTYASIRGGPGFHGTPPLRCQFRSEYRPHQYRQITATARTRCSRGSCRHRQSQGRPCQKWEWRCCWHRETCDYWAAGRPTTKRR